MRRPTTAVVCSLLLCCVRCGGDDRVHVFGSDIELDRPALEPIFGENFEPAWHCAVVYRDTADYYMQRVDDAMRASCDSGYPGDRDGYLNCISAHQVVPIGSDSFCLGIAKCAGDLPRRYRAFQCRAWAAGDLHDCFESADTPSARIGCDIAGLRDIDACSARLIRTVTQEERDLWRRTCEATGEGWE